MKIGIHFSGLISRWPLLASLGVALVLAVGCGDGDGQGESDGGLPRLGTRQDEPIIEGFGVHSELVTEADFPVTLAFAPDGRLFYNELLNGNIRIITPQGKLLERPFAHVDLAPGQVPPGEIGLIGLALDPEFESNHYVYVYFTAPTESGGGEKPTIMRFTDVDNVGTDPTVIGDLPQTLPNTGIHVGGNIHFGPDGYLYVTIGDNTVKRRLKTWARSSARSSASIRRTAQPLPTTPSLTSRGPTRASSPTACAIAGISPSIRRPARYTLRRTATPIATS